MKKLNKVLLVVVLLGTVITSCKKVAIKDLEADVNSGEATVIVQPTNAKGDIELASGSVPLNIDSIINSLNAFDYTISSIKVKFVSIGVVNAGVGINLNPIDSIAVNAEEGSNKKTLASAYPIGDDVTYIEPTVTNEDLVSILDKKTSKYVVYGKVTEDIKNKLVLNIKARYKIVFKHKG